MFWHPTLKLLLMVYVGDFKMSGPTASLAKGWKIIREGLLLEDPTPVDRCLGCHHHETTGTVNGKPVKIMQFNVESFMQQCVTAYKDLCGEPDMNMRAVETPHLSPLPREGGGDAPAALVEGEPVGVLQPIASSILMKVLYGARAARWDLLKAVQLLATRVTKWSRECDKASHRLMCYIN